MPADSTEEIRRALVASLNTSADPREQLEWVHGQVWDTGEMTAAFDVLSFAAPFVIVRRKSDGQQGSLMFQHRPRFYFRFQGAT